MNNDAWVLCPNCQSKTRIRVLEDTVIKNFPLFCPKCKKEYLVDIERRKIVFSRQFNTEKPDAKTQSIHS